MTRGKKLLLIFSVTLAFTGAAVFYLARNYIRHTPGKPQPVPTSGDLTLDAIRRGLAFLQAHQEEDGHFVAGLVAPKASFTALVIEAAVNSPDRLRPRNHPWLARAVQALLAEQKPDGGIYTKIPGMSFGNYSTSLAVMALSSLQDPAYKPAIDRACAYLRKNQRIGGNDDPLRGGMDYGGSGKPDLNNTMTMLEALRAAGVPADDPAYKAAVEFVQNTQNRSESNPQPWAGDDGGFIYRPAESPAGSSVDSQGRVRYASYGTMSYAGLVSFLYAHVDKNDPRVRSAFQWVQKHYDLHENVGMKDVGLYYYYRIMAKALAAYGEPIITTPDGAQHRWAEELAENLLRLQQPDGSWVNDNTAYLEGDPILVTAYAVRALSICYEEMQKYSPSPSP